MMEFVLKTLKLFLF